MPGVGVVRSAEYEVRRSVVFDPAILHHANGVAYVLDDREIVRDEDHGQVALRHGLLEQRQYLCLDGHIEG